MCGLDVARFNDNVLDRCLFVNVHDRCLFVNVLDRCLLAVPDRVPSEDRERDGGGPGHLGRRNDPRGAGRHLGTELQIEDRLSRVPQAARPDQRNKGRK